MRIFARAVSLFALMMGLDPVHSSAEANKGQFSYCAVPPGYREITARSDLPPALRTLFQDWVMPGEPWNSSDALLSSHLPNHGLYFVWNKGQRWIVGLGEGGNVVSPPRSAKAYQIEASGEAKNIGQGTRGTLCEQARSLENQ